MSRAVFCDTSGPWAGWAVRFLLHGWDVALMPGVSLGPVEEALAQSQAPGLYDRPLPRPGALLTAASAAEALEGAQWVMAGAAQLPAGAPAEAILAGSDGNAEIAGFAPADLIPAVEVWGREAARAAEILQAIGCDPVRSAGGIVARLRAALSEAAQAGLAMGLDAEGLSRLIAHGLAPGDAVSGPYRGPDAGARGADAVAVMRALKAQGRGVGRVLLNADARLGGLPERLEDLDPARPLLTLAQAVPSDWADYNGHMTEARYLDCFGRATDRFMMLIGCDADYIAAGQSFFTAETHICHLAEIRIGEPVRVKTQLLAAPQRKVRLFHRLWGGDTLCATAEHMLIHVSLKTRRAAPFGHPVAVRLDGLMAAQADLPWPDAAGRAIGERG